MQVPRTYIKLLKSVMVCAIVGSLCCFTLLVPYRASAVDLPQGIYAPSGEWVLLEPNASRTYSFVYNHNQNADKPSEVLVQLESHIPDAFNFLVMRSDSMELVGSGASLSKQTGQANDATKMVWTGRATETIEFYVIVANNHSFPNAYRLSVNGTAIFFPSLLVDSEQFGVEAVSGKSNLNKPQADAIPTQPGPIQSKSGIKKLPDTDNSALASLPGSSPDRALVMDGGWTTIEGNAAIWYSYKHSGDENSVEIQLDTEVVDALKFQVMTSRMKIFGASIPKVRVTNVSSDDSKLIWSSQTLISGTYFVEVKNSSAFPVRYKIELLQ